MIPKAPSRGRIPLRHLEHNVKKISCYVFNNYLDFRSCGNILKTFPLPSPLSVLISTPTKLLLSDNLWGSLLLGGLLLSPELPSWILVIFTTEGSQIILIYASATWPLQCYYNVAIGFGDTCRNRLNQCSARTKWSLLT